MKASVDTKSSTSKPRIEYFKIDDGHILVRVTRGNTVTEATISTVPPEKVESEEDSPVSVACR